MRDDFDGSSDLQQFIVLSLGVGLANLTESVSFIPMVLSMKDTEVVLCVITSEPFLDAAADYLASLQDVPDRYSIIFSGQIRHGNDVSRGVIAHAGERGDSYASTFFQSFDFETLTTQGAPEYIGRADQLLRIKDKR